MILCAVTGTALFTSKINYRNNGKFRRVSENKDAYSPKLVLIL